MNPSATEHLEPRPWTNRFWWAVFILLLAIHLGLLFVFSDKKPLAVRPVTGVPALKLADARDEFIVLNDPTLFALPHPNDFVTPVWNQPPVLTPPAFYWTEPPRWLSLAAPQLGATFGRYMATNQFAAWTPDFKPEPQFSTPALPVTWALPQRSTLLVRGELARRPLLNCISLPDWPETDIIAPSKVQVLVNSLGQVVSAVLLAPDYGFETAPHDDKADQQALALAQAARFGPAPQSTLGQLIFTWHTVPATPAPAPVNATNGLPNPR